MDGLSVGRIAESDRVKLVQAVTPEEFLEFISDKNLDDLRSSREEKLGIEFSRFLHDPVDRDYRYVFDPAHPGKVIDIHHLLAIAEQGRGGQLVGLGIEIYQAYKYPPSAFLEEDLRSNAHGERFGTDYLGRYGSLEADFRKLFEDLEREETPLRQTSLRQQGSRLEVEVARELLQDLDYLPKQLPSNKFDAEVGVAVRKFQEDTGLPETGEIDFQTWKALVREGDIQQFAEEAKYAKEFEEEHGDLAFRDTGDRVEAIQRKLAESGHLSEKNINGRFDRFTVTAVRTFQEENGLPVNGTIDFRTYRALTETAPERELEKPIDQPQVSQPETYPILRLEASGAEVEELQHRLKNLGYEVGEIDGRYGPKAAAAVRAFQGDNNLASDGEAGPQTWQALVEASLKQERASRPQAPQQVSQPEAHPTLRLQDSGPEVEELQIYLKNLGYEVGEVDGQYGPKAVAAVRAFQSDNNLAPNGEAGPQTWQALVAATQARSQPIETAPERPQTRDTATPTVPLQTNSQDSLPRRLWRNFTEALGIAGKIGRDEVSFALPSNGRQVSIGGETATQTVWGAVGPEREFFARLQIRDGELLADIPEHQRSVAEEAAQHVGEALQVAESIARRPQAALEA